jgi:hypothetical protein
MRMLALVVLITLGVSVALGQVEHLVEGDVESGGFGGPVLKITSINGVTGILVGGRGGWIINHTFILGGGGYGLVNYVHAATPGPDGEPYINFGYGGLELEYVRNWQRLIHFSVGLLIGGGGVGYRTEHYTRDWDTRAFFVMEPWTEIHVNVATFFRMSGGVSYRFVIGADSPVASDSQLSGVSGILTFRFGSF